MYARKRKFCKGCKGKDAVLCARFISRCTLICRGEMYAEAPNLIVIIFLKLLFHLSPIKENFKGGDAAPNCVFIRWCTLIRGGEMYARNLCFATL